MSKNILTRVKVKPEDGRAKTYVLMNVKDVSFLGRPAITGTNFENQSQTHLIELKLVKSREIVEQDRMYGGYIVVKKIK